ncbi:MULTISPECIES: polysaccharide deacetylase family protein [unclassified Sedimentibacter]|uniref:polysaccharide deacetylase family protein n=1 Tax=unclassified Sedimentibacter TaxID=2649220 RepID=UPI0027E1210D|nr:polysaccharide deacetylase family protein [Sedimentibacter sp. MB35-C1]WMJ76111.1 polysaccharide deacetylase family protein [Sedimentibacter sp. MB35-C1]
MKKKYLSIMAITIAFILSGCFFAQDDKSPEQNEPDNQVSVEPKEAEDPEEKPEKSEEDPIEEIDLSIQPNELGEIMILMYHGIGEEEMDWQRTPDNFRKDLQYMYDNKYQMISLNDYAKGEIKTKAGYTPIILTFDDGRQNNFNYIEKDGDVVIDSDCAVGILEEFKNKYPDFDVTASFFLNTNPFGQSEYTEQKLKWLVDNGYDVGNHTYSHLEMETLDSEEDIQAEIGSVNNIIKSYLPDYAVETLALPHGSNPKDAYAGSVMEGEYEGSKYKTIAILDVGWRPAYSPFDTLTDFTSLYRVTASEINVDNCGMYDYFKSYENGNRERFISDGNPDVVTIPKRHEEYLNMEMVGEKTVNIYEEN